VRTIEALTGHQIPDRAALHLNVGQRVEVGERDTRWPEFVFVTAADGSGWVPARHLSRSAGSAVVQTAYDTTELPTQPGDVLEVLAEDRRSGWLWCRTSHGAAGWVPANTLKEE
jgi:Variant SH3 domain